MRVLVTGASGFIGTEVVGALLARASLAGSAIDEIVALDPAPPSRRFATETRVRPIVGDAADAALLTSIVDRGVDAIFALGATLTSDAEADVAHGYDVNLHGILRLLDACRASARSPSGSAPRLVFASSIAAFGGALPTTVDDDQKQTPRTSYGTQKAMVELVIDDYARHGFVDGRCLRLPIVLVRPGAPVASVSDRLAALIRAPLRGEDVACPWRPETRVTVASVRTVARALVALGDVPTSAFGPARASNLPAVSVRIDEIDAAMGRVAHARGIARGRVDFVPDAHMQAIVDGWPQRFVSSRAAALGIVGDASIDSIIEDFVASPGTP